MTLHQLLDHIPSDATISLKMPPSDENLILSVSDIRERMCDNARLKSADVIKIAPYNVFAKYMEVVPAIEITVNLPEIV